MEEGGKEGGEERGEERREDSGKKRINGNEEKKGKEGKEMEEKEKAERKGWEGRVDYEVNKCQVGSEKENVKGSGTFLLKKRCIECCRDIT